MSVVAFLLVAFAGAFVQTVTGFALGMILIALAAGLELVSISVLTATASLLSLMNVGMALRAQGRFVHWGFWRFVTLGQVPAIGLGLALMLYLEGNALRWLEGLLGAFVLIGSLSMLRGDAQRHTLSPPWRRTGAGFAGGLVGGMFSASGPVMGWFFYRQPLPIAEIRATLLACFGVTTSVRTLLVGGQGGLTQEVWVLTAASAPAVLLGTWIGSRIGPRLDALKLRRFAFGLLTLMGLLIMSRAAFGAAAPYDLVLRGGDVIDGTGAPAVRADVAILGQRVMAVGPSLTAGGSPELDVSGQVVAPGFINMLSWAGVGLLVDGRAMSDLKQGVTLEVMGEGRSMGPVSPAARKVADRAAAEARANNPDAPADPFAITWNTLDEYLETLVARGVAPNVASFVGASTVREYVAGGARRAMTATELARMQDLVRDAMRDGALGVSSALIYAPGQFANTEELIALARAAGEFGGGYISHLRSEARGLDAGIAELIEIAERADTWAEVYHLKASGRANWHRLDNALAAIDAARERGVSVRANMYPYAASATGLDAVMPPWVQAGGVEAWVKRLQDPAIRERVLAEMADPEPEWENYLLDGPQYVRFLGFKTEALQPYIGRTLADVAEERGTSPARTAIDLVIEDGSQVQVAYFLLEQKQVRHIATKPWVTFGSDAAAPPVVRRPTRMVHPRTFGTFARVIGAYVRDGLLTLPEAVHRLSGLPAAHLRLSDRGLIAPGMYADLVVFSPEKVRDRATFDAPYRYAEGVAHVFVNGTQVLRDGRYTGAKPGQVVRGPGYRGRR